MNRLNLKIVIDQTSGFCFGVKRAIEMAEKAAEQNHAWCLGEIVHNEKEIERLEHRGLSTVDQAHLPGIKNSFVVFRAHGEPPSSYRQAGENNNTVIDATCPIILKIRSKMIQAWENGESIYLFGKHHHPEVIGLNGHIHNQATVFEQLSELDPERLPSSLTLFSQTTMPLEKYRQVIALLENQGIQVKSYQTICRVVSRRYDALSRFCEKVDKLIFLSGKMSSNGKVLYDICKKANPHSYLIHSFDELSGIDFAEGETIGLTGATSTPIWQIEELKARLEEL